MEKTNKEKVHDIEEDLFTRVKEGIDISIHDTNHLVELMLLARDNPTVLRRYASDGTLRTACESVMYYLNRLIHPVSCLETTKKIQAIYENESREDRHD